MRAVQLQDPTGLRSATLADERGRTARVLASLAHPFGPAALRSDDPEAVRLALLTLQARGFA
jgi:hypothetical protein